RATAKAGELGLYRATDGVLSAVTAAGPLNPKEVADMRASAEVLQPVAGASGGSVQWLADGVPEVRRVGSGDSASGSGWIGLRNNGAYRVTALEQQKLLPQWLALLLIVGALLLAWRLEGRSPGTRAGPDGPARGLTRGELGRAAGPLADTGATGAHRIIYSAAPHFARKIEQLAGLQ
ncbi:MAG: hypothetical protein V4601_10255, partial [Pseudomonadota bacterium]